MSVILEIDAGNTALKWRVVGKNSAIVDRGVLLLDDACLLFNLVERFPVVDAVRLSCVAKNEIREMLLKQISSHWGVVVTVAQTQHYFKGLTIAYKNPQRFGVDRWLAMLAARNEIDGAVCVIDCGSAVTIDMVAANGQHQGGYIVPGLAMQIKALLDNTGQIHIESDLVECAAKWGCSTEEAVNFGVTHMLVSFIDAIVAEFLLKDVQPVVFLTGGDGAKLLPRLKHQQMYYYRPELVMDGLAVALLVNS